MFGGIDCYYIWHSYRSAVVGWVSCDAASVLCLSIERVQIVKQPNSRNTLIWRCTSFQQNLSIQSMVYKVYVCLSVRVCICTSYKCYYECWMHYFIHNTSWLFANKIYINAWYQSISNNTKWISNFRWILFSLLFSSFSILVFRGNDDDGHCHIVDSVIIPREINM